MANYVRFLYYSPTFSFSETLITNIEFFGIAFDLEFFTDVCDLSYLNDRLDAEPFGHKYSKLSKVLCELIEDFSLVSFTTLNIQVKTTPSSSSAGVCLS